MTSSNQSDWHHYALDKSGAIIHLVRDCKIAREDYYCIGCGKVVRPVMGDERDWHFRHLETNPDCDHESWLHRFAKLVTGTGAWVYPDASYLCTRL